MKTKLRLPDGEIVNVAGISDIRVKDGSVTVDTGGNGLIEKKSFTFKSTLSQKKVDEIWNVAITDLKGVVVSWEDYDKKPSVS